MTRRPPPRGRFNYWTSGRLLQLKRAAFGLASGCFIAAAICASDDYPNAPLCVFVVLFMLYCRFALWKVEESYDVARHSGLPSLH